MNTCNSNNDFSKETLEGLKWFFLCKYDLEASHTILLATSTKFPGPWALVPVKITSIIPTATTQVMPVASLLSIIMALESISTLLLLEQASRLLKLPFSLQMLTCISHELGQWNLLQTCDRILICSWIQTLCKTSWNQCAQFHGCNSYQHNINLCHCSHPPKKQLYDVNDTHHFSSHISDCCSQIFCWGQIYSRYRDWCSHSQESCGGDKNCAGVYVPQAAFCLNAKFPQLIPQFKDIQALTPNPTEASSPRDDNTDVQIQSTL